MSKLCSKKQNISDSTISNSTVLQSAGDINISIVGDSLMKQVHEVSNNDFSCSITKNKKSIASKRAVLIIRVVLIFATIFVLAIGGFWGYHRHKYKMVMENADTKLKGGKYDAALELYQQAELTAITDSELVKAHCFQGDCYMIMGIIDIASTSPDNTDILTESNYVKAVKIYNDIISNEKYKNTEYYYDAAAGLSNCYYFLNYSFNDSNWKKAISIMETKVDSIVEPANYSEISQIAKLDYALGIFYSNVAMDSIDNIHDKELSDKALKYLLGYAKCVDSIRTAHGIRAYNLDVYFSGRVADMLLNRAITSDNALGIINSVISMCEVTLSSIKESDYSVDSASIFQLKYTLGKAYYYLSVILPDEQKQGYREKSYVILSSILKVEYELAYSDLENAGYYCVFTGKCNATDINQILNNINAMKEHILTNGYKEFSKNDISTLSNALSTCAFITICYEDESGAMDIGREISDEMMKRVDHMDQEMETSLQKYYDYFHGGKIIPEFEKKIYDSLLVE